MHCSGYSTFYRVEVKYQKKKKKKNTGLASSTILEVKDATATTFS